MEFDIDAPLIEFAGEHEDATISVKDACSGLLIIGATGSGKSSASLRCTILNLLAKNCGGLVLCVKSEIEAWTEYCRLTGREKDLLILKPGGEHSFNFLEYSSSQKSEPTFVSNITALLNSVIQTSKGKKEGHSDDPFWENCLSLLMHNCISLCMLSVGNVSLPLLYDMALSVKSNEPDSTFNKAFQKAEKKIDAKLKTWTQIVGAEYLESLGDYEFNNLLYDAIPEAREWRLLEQFFLETFRKLNPKTQSIVELSFIGFLFSLMQEPVYSLFCSKPCTFKPEDSFLQSKIILLDLPTKIYGQAGQYVQLIFKGIWQKAMECRDTKANNRPVFLVSDECQELLSESDNTFLATARSSLVSTIYITQNLPNLYACMGGAKSEHRIKGLLGNFATKIFHANTDVETNTWAESLIGQAFQADEVETITNTNGSTSTAKAISVKLQHIVRKEAFSMLVSGGAKAGFRVGAYIHVQGKKFSTGFNHRLVFFSQNYIPKLQNSIL